MLKFDRAEYHLAQLKDLLPVNAPREPHPVVERFDPNENGGTWFYNLALEFQVTENILPIIGDFLFNVRSGLDQLAAACVIPADKHLVQFPIFWEDPISLNSATGGHLNPKAWKSWKGRTAPFGKVTGLLTAIEGLQPFQASRKEGKEPTHHVLAVLAVLQDTDKHQQVVVAPEALRKIALTVDGETIYLVPGMHNGELLHFSKEQTDVQIVGSLHVGIGQRREVLREFPFFFDQMLNAVARDVLPALEPFLK